MADSLSLKVSGLWCSWNAACDSILAYGRAMFLKEMLTSPVSCLCVAVLNYHPATGKALIEAPLVRCTHTCQSTTCRGCCLLWFGIEACIALCLCMLQHWSQDVSTVPQLCIVWLAHVVALPLKVPQPRSSKIASSDIQCQLHTLCFSILGSALNSIMTPATCDCRSML